MATKKSKPATAKVKIKLTGTPEKVAAGLKAISKKK
jgi:hypothetical protein